MSASDEMSQGPIIRDRRRIDPVTGQPRRSGDTGPDAGHQAPAAQPGGSQAGQTQPSGAQPRPGRHAVSKPGSPRQEAAGPGDADSGIAAPDEAAGTGAGGGAGTGAGGGTGSAGPAGATGPETAGSGPGAAGSKAEKGGAPAGSAVADLTDKLAERTADLQRLQAEYANYRKRVERDRAAMRDLSIASVLGEFLPVLDDIGRARDHGELNGGFKSVADSLEAAVAKLGLIAYGQAGEPFDPNIHEALMHSYSADVAEATCVQVLQPGYKVGERILRPARVAVAEPAEIAEAPGAAAPDSEAGGNGDQPPAGGPHDSD